ncbi:hypothetical protein ACWGJQ_04155 [Peribacillus simplex]
MQLLLCLRQSKSFLYTVLDLKGKAFKEKQYKCNYFSVSAIQARQSKSFLYTVLDLKGKAFKENSVSATTSLSSPIEEFSLHCSDLKRRAFKENSVSATTSLS